MIPSFYITVKYLREVTPYFRKATVLADLGWELQSGFLGAQTSFLPQNNGEADNTSDKSEAPLTNGPDTRSITLLFCHLTKSYTCKGKNRTFNLFITIIVTSTSINA